MTRYCYTLQGWEELTDPGPSESHTGFVEVPTGGLRSAVDEVTDSLVFAAFTRRNTGVTVKVHPVAIR